ncbi:MAG: hypothetical protein JNM96_03915, partial [Bacteroidia bacterium]|nr:hypothetical protein [Bacteroidia bacterium]
MDKIGKRNNEGYYNNGGKMSFRSTHVFLQQKAMNRKTFLKSLAILPLTAVAMKLNDLNKMTESFTSTDKMPVLF